ncbi:MAG: hypothetical protein Q9196_006759, partial [Gyalolechia fulgens]
MDPNQRYVELLQNLTAALETFVKSSGSDVGKAPSATTIAAQIKGDLVNGSASKAHEGEAKGDRESREDDKDLVVPVQQVPRVRSVINKWNQEKDRREDYEVSLVTSVTADAKLTFRRVMDYDDEKKCVYSEVDIDHDGVKKLMEETMAHVAPGTFINAVNYISPFEAIVYNWDALNNATTASNDDDEERKEAREDLDKLLNYVKSTPTPALEGYFKIRELSLANKTMEYKHLWTLFGPGTRVYAQSFLNDMQMFECQVTTYMDKDGLKPKLVVCCAAYDWDGAGFRRYSYRFYINQYQGPRAINSLACFPVQYYQNDKEAYDDADLRVALIERGRKFVQLCTAKPDELQCDYNGLALTKNPGMTRLTTVDTQDDPRWQRSLDDSDLPETGRSIRIKERIIVDNFSYLHSSRNASMDPSQLPPLGVLTAVEGAIWDCSCSACRTGPAQDWHHRPDRGSNEQFGSSEERLLFCPPKILGYVLTKKIWGQFRVKDANPCQYDENLTSLFETKLELEDRNKKLLKAFIDNHENARRQTSHSTKKVTDLIEGKGRGL